MTEVVVEGTRDFVSFWNSVDRTSARYREILNILYELRANPVLGDKIRRRLWPKSYVKRYGILVLFRVKMSGGWRMLYTISKANHTKTVTVLEVMNHAEYENRFGY